MPVKFGKTSVLIDRNTKKKSIVHEYMKTKSNQELIDAYNKPVIPKLRQKVKNEIVRRNKIGKCWEIEEKLKEEAVGVGGKDCFVINNVVSLDKYRKDNVR